MTTTPKQTRPRAPRERITAAEVMRELETLGDPQIKRIFARHGCPENSYGVRIGDMKGIVKRIRTDSTLAKELWTTGNTDAMYLAGLIADGADFSEAELDGWAHSATWYMLTEFTVAWVASESQHAWTLAMRWIDGPTESLQCAGWATLAALCSTRPDDTLDVESLRALLNRVAATIHDTPNYGRYCMNTFVISAGSYVRALTEPAKATARQVGKVHVDMGETSCRVPDAITSIDKTIGRRGYKKRKTAKC